ncbi:MAG: SDR family oxidoreductase [Candidatus Eremiobacteraeota bacterium]|nr:SDR family oxidoreductase [Candidatus Eremiobacteraeota bacterium]
MGERGTILIAGASGVVGNAAAEHFASLGGWDVIALSRRAPEIEGRPLRHVAVDLRDAAATRLAMSTLGDVTHVVYAALYEKPGLIPGWVEQDQMQTNLAMLQHLLEPLTETSKQLRHVTLLQGTKAYGVHLHPMPIPARECAPRDQHENFYWLQEDYLKSKAGERGFDWTIFRPQLIVGGVWGVAMNLAPIVGAYAAICSEEGEPFGFPGGVSFVSESVDARVVAHAFAWAADSPLAVHETFNITNGDVFEWRNLWPMLAKTLGVDPGPDKPVSMATYLPARADVWDRIVEKHGLRKVPMRDLLGESHHYADLCFAYGAQEPFPPVFVSAVKLRQAGFTELMDTEDMWCYWLERLMEKKLLPKAV